MMATPEHEKPEHENTPEKREGALRPQRRHPALIPLSHDHHEGLIAAQRLKRGEAAYRNCSDAVESIVLLWERELDLHFRLEEEHLFTHGGSTGELAAMTGRALDEHAEFRKMVEVCREGGGDEPLVRRFGALLESHIRFEERQLFPAFQEHLAESDLAELGAAILQDRPPRSCSI